VLESAGHEGGDGEEDRQDPVGVGACPVAEPHCKADQGVTQDAAKEDLAPGEGAFCGGDLHRRLSHITTGQGILTRRDHQIDQDDRANQVARIDNGPVAEHGRAPHATAEPGHGNQGIAGEEFRAPDHDENEAETEAQPAQ